MPTPTPPATTSPGTLAVALAGGLTLAVAMGIGRFAFTPLMPLMMRDGLIDAAGGAELAAANYLGYLLGAFSAARLARQPLRLVLASLLAIVLLTSAGGLGHSVAAWAWLRGGAGMASAWAMVGISSWALSLLAQRGQAALGALVYAGVGAGIVLAGVLAWALAGIGARGLWWLLGAVALLLTGGVAWLVRAGPSPGASAGGPAAAAARPAAGPSDKPAGALNSAATRSTSAGWPLVLCYGATGFGYILPATFLPAMARSLVDDPQRFGLAWPLFGLAAMASTLAAGLWLARWPAMRTWALCQAAIGLGAALPLLSRSGLALLLAALAVGGSFMVATLVALQQARALAPLNPAPLLGRLTAAFALGQIAGPLLVRALAGLPLPAGLDAIEAASALAALLMALTAAWLWRLSPSAANPSTSAKPLNPR